MFFYFLELKFRFTLVHSLFNILREIFLTSLGYFRSSVILLNVFLDRICSAKQFKKLSQYQKTKSEIETG